MIIMLLRASLHINLSLHSLLFPLYIFFLSFLEASRLFLCPSYDWNSVTQLSLKTSSKDLVTSEVTHSLGRGYLLTKKAAMYLVLLIVTRIRGFIPGC